MDNEQEVIQAISDIINGDNDWQKAIKIRDFVNCHDIDSIRVQEWLSFLRAVEKMHVRQVNVLLQQFNNLPKTSDQDYDVNIPIDQCPSRDHIIWLDTKLRKEFEYIKGHEESID